MINEAMIDQVGTKALSTAIGVLGPRLVAALAKSRGQRRDDLSIARWFETYRISESPPDLPGLTPALAKRLAEALNGDATQAALQVLLAAGLTDADNVEAARAREVFCLTLSTADPELSPFGPPLAEYYDDEITSMVARLEAAEPTMLTQIRSEAFSARMLDVLRAIERHGASLSAQQDMRSEASLLASYRRHVIDEHGKLKPPDFDRRSLVPISDIYVPPTIFEDTHSDRAVAASTANPPGLSVWDLAGRLDRTVLLGDPGGGKTTASHVLMHYFASAAAGRIPFLVTLRNYAAADPPQYSVVGHIESELKTFYQCPAPPGLVDMLLLTGRAVVIFDGLDELLDTSRRADVASRVEHFCREYPLALVLITSRVVGYDQARLDESQFVSFRLGGFRDTDVTAYARKWFALQEGASKGDAETFLAESESVPDLRANPLLLSLMCILYRGDGSLPRNRAEVYEQCARLLFKRWDSHRHINQELLAGRYVEPILRYLAWWLFTRDNAQTSVTERELVAATTGFLHGRGFESEDDAREAALQFIEYSCGRLWVFNDAGTSATGEKLYAFTHRTFLEYFAACQIAYDCDTPEKLARTLAPHAARGEWEIVGELAVQIKETTSRDGAQRVYEALLDERRRRAPEGRSKVLCFLAQTLRSVTPPPQTIRRLTREALDFLFSGDPDDSTRYMPIVRLLVSLTPSTDIVSEEIADAITGMIDSTDPVRQVNGIHLALVLDRPISGMFPWMGIQFNSDPRIIQFWSAQVSKLALGHINQILSRITQDPVIRSIALSLGLITTKQALEVPNGLQALLQPGRYDVFLAPREAPLLRSLLNVIGWNSDHKPFDADDLERLAAVGQYISDNPVVPWVTGIEVNMIYGWSDNEDRKLPQLDLITNLGGLALSLIMIEAGIARDQANYLKEETWLGPFSAAQPYAVRRLGLEVIESLPELPVPDQFKQVFLDWAEGKVNFTDARNPGAGR
jgi:hypothetical protein